MTQGAIGAPPSVLELKGVLAEALVRSGLDYSDDILILNAFIRDFRWEQGVPPTQKREDWRALRRGRLPPSHQFSLYLHIPYCRQKCHYCYCASVVALSQAQVDEIVSELCDEIAFYAEALQGARIDLFQMGGGTPSLLSPGQIRRLLSRATEAFELEEGGLRTFEFNPASTDRRKLEAARRYGRFNRVSFGVQTFNPAALHKINREYQTFEMVRDAVRGAREAGIEAVNLDLILNLEGDTLEGLVDSVRKAASLRPTSITIAGLSMTDRYLRLMGISREDNLRRYDSYLPRALEALRPVAREEGYGADELLPERGNWVLLAEGVPASVRSTMERSDHFAGGPQSILGLGRYSRSHLFGRGFYERLPRAFRADMPLYRRVRFERKDEMARFILYSMENGNRLSYEEFMGRFGEDARHAFEIELKALRSLGMIRTGSRGFDFVPVRGPRRIFYGMFFLMDLLARLPFTRGAINEDLRARLERELEDESLEGEG